MYYDGQFDDARLLIHLAMTAADQGATVVNYCPATGLLRDEEGYVNGLIARDDESGEAFSIRAKVVINATGVFTDEIRRMADPGTEPLMVTSQGIHLVFDRSFLKGDTALMVPRTSDGRVLFVIPWHGHAVAGTTDTPVDGPSLEPKPLDEEIQFILETAGRYLTRPPSRSDVLSRLRWSPSARQIGRPIGQHCRNLPRSYDSRRHIRPPHHHRRKVDNLPPYGRGHRRSRHHFWPPPRRALHNQEPEDSRLPERTCRPY